MNEEPKEFHVVAERTGAKEVTLYLEPGQKIVCPLHDVEDLINDLKDALHADACPECEGSGIVREGCGNCGGSGEGMHDGSSCSVCHGRGEVGVQCECGVEPPEPAEREWPED